VVHWFCNKARWIFGLLVEANRGRGIVEPLDVPEMRMELPDLPHFNHAKECATFGSHLP
jgi:hypothetical protein